MIKGKSVLGLLYVVVLLLVFHAVSASFRDEEERCDIFYDRRMTRYFNFTQKGLRYAQFYVAAMKKGIVPLSSNSIYFVNEKFEVDLSRNVIFNNYLQKVKREVELDTPYEYCLNRIRSSQCKSTPPVGCLYPHKIKYPENLYWVDAFYPYFNNTSIKRAHEQSVLNPSEESVLEPSGDIKKGSFAFNLICSNCTFIVNTLYFPKNTSLPASNVTYFQALICSISTIHQDDLTEKTTDIVCVSPFKDVYGRLYDNFQIIMLYDYCGALLSDYYLANSRYYTLLLGCVDSSVFTFAKPNIKNLTLLVPSAYSYSSENYTLSVVLNNNDLIEAKKWKHNDPTMFYYVEFTLKKDAKYVDKPKLLVPVMCTKVMIFTNASRKVVKASSLVYISFFCGKDFFPRDTTQVEVIVQPKMKEFDASRFSVPLRSNQA